MNKYQVISFDLDEPFEIEALNDVHAVYCATSECFNREIRLDSIYDITDENNRRCVIDTVNLYLKIQDYWLQHLIMSKDLRGE